ncbi:MAG TPA: response regulator [Victivallales bacterium]|mgnify:CR=1 FL=1|nr:response regulator [Victivallales bacterium]
MRKKTERILVVDDDKYNLFILKQVLSENYNIAIAEDGASALSTLSKFQPDLIIQDIMLPDMDGFELCRRLKEAASPRLVKIILISARSDISDRLKGYECGADDYIIKPFETEELLAKVKVFVRLKHVEEVERLKEDVINLFAHEVRTPLSSILGFAELLETTTTLDKKQHELINHIILNTKDLLFLAEKSIFLNSIGDSTPELKINTVSAQNIVENALESRKPLVARKKIRLLKDIHGDFTIECDGKLVTDSIAALLDNAIKYSSSGSAVLISATKENGSAHFIIKDSGTGFPRDFDTMALKKNGLYDINYHSRGFGIGLTFVKCVAELHRGKLSLVSTGEKGSTIELSLPLIFK